MVFFREALQTQRDGDDSDSDTSDETVPYDLSENEDASSPGILAATVRERGSKSGEGELNCSCPHCLFELNPGENRGALLSHIRTAHPIDTDRINEKKRKKCKTRDKNTEKYAEASAPKQRNKNPKSKHSKPKIASSMGDLALLCPYCPYSIEYDPNKKQSLQAHIKLSHPDKFLSERLCQQCGRSFHSKQILRAHVKKEHDKNTVKTERQEQEQEPGLGIPSSSHDVFAYGNRNEEMNPDSAKTNKERRLAATTKRYSSRRLKTGKTDANF